MDFVPVYSGYACIRRYIYWCEIRKPLGWAKNNRPCIYVRQNANVLSKGPHLMWGRRSKVQHKLICGTFFVLFYL